MQTTPKFWDGQDCLIADRLIELVRHVDAGVSWLVWRELDNVRYLAKQRRHQDPPAETNFLSSKHCFGLIHDAILWTLPTGGARPSREQVIGLLLAVLEAGRTDKEPQLSVVLRLLETHGLNTTPEMKED